VVRGVAPVDRSWQEATQSSHGDHRMAAWSPTVLLQRTLDDEGEDVDASAGTAAAAATHSVLPPCLLLHGELDPISGAICSCVRTYMLVPSWVTEIILRFRTLRSDE
jgi:hypothetical protein